MDAISSLDAYELSDRYDREHGRVFLTGTQAIVRIALDQARRDRAAGLNTGGFISGYRGSPPRTALPHPARHSCCAARRASPVAAQSA